MCDSIYSLLDVHAPYVTYRISKPYAPWFTDTLRAAKKDRDRALSRFKRTKDPSDWSTYKTLRNSFTLAVRREKKLFTLPHLIKINQNNYGKT